MFSFVVTTSPYALVTKQSHATTCQFKLVDCTNESCDEKVTRRDLDRHVTSECQWRIVHCPYCRESFICKFSQVINVL